MDTADLILLLKVKLRGVSSSFEHDTLDSAVQLASIECGWALPVMTSFRAHWLLERAYRHCIAMMCADTASKFKFKQINLQHRFDHWFKMLQELDKQFEKTKETHAAEFPIESALSDTAIIALFGDYQPVTMANLHRSLVNSLRS